MSTTDATDYCGLVICLYLQFRFAVSEIVNQETDAQFVADDTNDATMRYTVLRNIYVRTLCDVWNCTLNCCYYRNNSQDTCTRNSQVCKCVCVRDDDDGYYCCSMGHTHTPQPSIDQFQDQLDANIEHTHTHIERSQSIEFRPFDVPFIRLVFHRNAILWNLNS